MEYPVCCSGLDAAQPGFEGCDRRVRLDKGDAKFVDAIHTNGAPLIPTMGFGFMTPFGRYMSQLVRDDSVTNYSLDILCLFNVQYTSQVSSPSET